ncbi:MAG TPA: STAS domain-containing protein [Mycobacteriales bacterium]
MTLPGHIGLEVDERSCRLALSGEVDGASAPAMHDALEQLAAAPPRAVTVDLAQTTYFDANGARFLLAVHDLVATSGGRVTVVGVEDPIRRVLAFTRLDRVLDIRDTVTTPAPVGVGGSVR